MNEKLLASKEIIDKAIKDYKPYAMVVMFSGGNDSRTLYHVVRALGYKPDALVHCVTGTGIQECHEYCRRFADNHRERLLIGNAGNKYNNYVLNSGWPGMSNRAHSFAYHLCKADQFRHVISRYFRKRKRGRNILMLNGVRAEESRNRALNSNYGEYYSVDPAAKRNIWVDAIWDWTKKECMDFLSEQDSKPSLVSALLHRSGDCMCGTRQRKEEAEEAAYWFPNWAKTWWYPMRARVMARGFTWDWGEHPPEGIKKQKLLSKYAYFTPACRACLNISDRDYE